MSVLAAAGRDRRRVQHIQRHVFSPQQIAGLVLWLSADAITSLADTAAVTTWADLSGLGNDATQSVAGLKPTYRTGVVNGRAVVRFDGTGDYLTCGTAASLNVPSGHSFFAVCSATDFLDYRGLLSRRNATSVAYAYFTSINAAAGKVSSYDGTAERNATVALTAGVVALVSAAYDGTTVSFYLNGAANGSGLQTFASQAAVATIIGNAREPAETDLWYGDIAEILLYNSALSAADRQRVERYLASRYGITLS